MAESLVELVAIRKLYGEMVAVTGIDLAIARGEFVVILGSSGSGKTTILSILGGFVAPTAGRVVIDGVDVTGLPPARRPTATVFQDYALFPHMNVASNVSFGLAMHKVAKPERQRRVDEVLDLVGLEGFGRRSVHQLSGGQQQRVALARAIAVRPTVLLLDEPLGALDLALRRQMQEELVQIQKRLGTTFVHVTHDQEEAMSVADTVVVLNQGRIEDIGPPRRVYLKPASVFAATFMGDNNLIPGRVEAASDGEVRIATPLGDFVLKAEAASGDRVRLAVRPEQLSVARSPGTNLVALGRAKVAAIVFQGTYWRALAMGGADRGVELRLRLPPSAQVEAGETVEVYADPADVVMLKEPS